MNRRVPAAWVVLGCWCMSGCVTSAVATRASRLLPPGHHENGDGAFPNDASASLSTQWLGSVPYDDDALPLFKPDGSLLAVRVGVPPTEALMTGRSSTNVAPIARIAVHALAPDVPRLYTIDGRYLLGRGVCEEGFLIEEPRKDGSRRIGLVEWASGDIEWLVDNAFVNAFADIAENGTLVYARRAVGSEPFELVLERHGTTTVFPSEWERSWIDPVLSPDGSTLFVLRLGDGTLELGWKRLLADLTPDATIHTRPISDRVNARIAHQALAAQPGLEASPPTPRACLIFRHPDLNRLVVWTPHDDLVRPFPACVVAATMLDSTHAVVTHGQRVVLITLPTEAGRSPRSLTLLEEFCIPRRNGVDRDSVLLLQPRDGRYELTRLDLLDVR